jgi:hypothetical protein
MFDYAAEARRRRAGRIVRNVGLCLVGGAAALDPPFFIWLALTTLVLVGALTCAAPLLEQFGKIWAAWGRAGTG